jgi:hypothetical protein
METQSNVVFSTRDVLQTAISQYHVLVCAHYRSTSIRQMKRQKDSSKKVVDFYFQPIPNEADRFQCKICPKIQRTQKAATGYSNLMSHIVQAHPNYEEEMRKSKEGTLSGIYITFVLVFFMIYRFLYPTEDYESLRLARPRN